MSSQPHYEGRSFAAFFLGELKAPEAVDALAACLDCHDGTVGMSSYRRPAFHAVIEIEPPAVSKLIETLKNGSPGNREYAALALGMIRGPEAVDALQNALATERDERVSTAIRIALQTR